MMAFEIAGWTSVVLKAAAALMGLVAAYRWYLSAVDTASAASLNRRAAVTTAISVFLQGLSVGIDAVWVAPGRFGP